MQAGRGRLLIALVLLLSGSGPAGAIVKGTGSSLGRHTVRLIGNGNCTGVVVSSHAVVTAAHCARGMRVVAAGFTIRVRAIGRSAVLDDGRVVHVGGDAAILSLQSSLPSQLAPAPIGAGSGRVFTIAGYGTGDERSRGQFGALQEAQLVAAGARVLIDPDRSGDIGASACFGDSGGPVFRGGELVGIVTRASYPARRIACGKFTHWAPVWAGAPHKSVAAAK